MMHRTQSVQRKGFLYALRSMFHGPMFHTTDSCGRGYCARACAMICSIFVIRPDTFQSST
jgi:hypothetical protein